MLTDYERYQLEWMIEHGHSLKEFVQGLDLVDRDGIDSLEEAYAIWENDDGFGGEATAADPLGDLQRRQVERMADVGCL